MPVNLILLNKGVGVRIDNILLGKVLIAYGRLPLVVHQVVHLSLIAERYIVALYCNNPPHTLIPLNYSSRKVLRITAIVHIFKHNQIWVIKDELTKMEVMYVDFLTEENTRLIGELNGEGRE